MSDNLYAYNSQYPSTAYLRAKAKKRVPKFAFEYLEGGCNEETNLHRNIEDFKNVLLEPEYLTPYGSLDMSCSIFGQHYDAPIGVAPIGLQGLMWPNAPEILAKAALKHNIPYILSTVSTGNIEDIAAASEGKFWFQLYHPTKDELRDDLLARLEAVECKVLVVLVDVPAFGLRYREIINGLSMPPKMNINNIFQAAVCPTWGIQTLINGIPNFGTLKKYMPKGLDMSQLGKFMNSTFTGRVDEEKIKAIRDKWKGKLVLKGIVNDNDCEKAIALGADGIIVSNHGGRQIDAGESTIVSLQRLSQSYGDKIDMTLDGGIRDGVDIARAMASGAKFTFAGRPFMYGLGALGNEGGDHTMGMLKSQLRQVMLQLGAENVSQLPSKLIKGN